jgi:hypothetical protein
MKALPLPPLQAPFPLNRGPEQIHPEELYLKEKDQKGFHVPVLEFSSLNICCGYYS